MEFQLLDQMSFLRFTRLADTSQIPDRTTIWTFKERLIKAGVSESVFDAVNRQLAKHGYIARGGQIIDASIVQVPRQSLNKEEKSIVEDNAMPADWSPPKRRQKDIEARWTKKHGKSYFGYKLSANADNRYKLICKLKVSTASEHDTNHFEDVLDQANTSWAILVDKGKVDGEREARLARGLAHVHPAQGRQGQAALGSAGAAQQAHRQDPCTRRARVRRSGSDGPEIAAQHWTGARDAASELEGCRIQTCGVFAT